MGNLNLKMISRRNARKILMKMNEKVANMINSKISDDVKRSIPHKTRFPVCKKEEKSLWKNWFEEEFKKMKLIDELEFLVDLNWNFSVGESIAYLESRINRQFAEDVIENGYDFAYRVHILCESKKLELRTM